MSRLPTQPHRMPTANSLAVDRLIAIAVLFAVIAVLVTN